MIKEDVSPPFHWSGLTPCKGMFCTLSMEGGGGGCPSLKWFSSAFGKAGKKCDVFYLSPSLCNKITSCRGRSLSLPTAEECKRLLLQEVLNLFLINLLYF